MQKAVGFSLVELMIVVAMIAIVVMVAIPSYQSYRRYMKAAQVQQEIQRIALLLEQHKARHFTYKGFNYSAAEIESYVFEVNDGTDPTISLNDERANGRFWTIRAITRHSYNESFLMNSTGLRCKNQVAENMQQHDCGVGSEPW